MSRIPAKYSVIKSPEGLVAFEANFGAVPAEHRVLIEAQWAPKPGKKAPAEFEDILVEVEGLRLIVGVRTSKVGDRFVSGEIKMSDRSRNFYYIPQCSSATLRKLALAAKTASEKLAATGN